MFDSSDLITAYAREPVNQGVMEEPTVRYEQRNTICGDSIIVYLRIAENWIISSYSHAGSPAIHTLAAASLLAETIEGSWVEEVLTRGYPYMQEQWFIVSPRRKRSAVSALLAARNAIHKRKKDSIIDEYDDLLGW